jgi:hypothetical protein
VSRQFLLDGFQVQIFRRNIMQLQPDGGVQTLNLLDPGLMPYTQINGSTFRARPCRRRRDAAGDRPELPPVSRSTT